MGFSNTIGINIGSEKSLDWSSYWTTRYPSALIGATYSGTRVDLSWTNNGDQDYDSVSIWGSTDNVTFTEYDMVAAGETSANVTGLTQVTTYYFKVAYKKGASYSDYTDVVSDTTLATAILDGNTVAWYQFDDLANITKNASEQISLWKDKSGNENDLVNSGADATKPVWTSSGVAFDTALQIISNVFDLGDPYMVYIVMQINQYGAGRHFLRGQSTNSLLCRLDTTDTGYLRHYNGALEIKTTAGYTLNENFVFRAGAVNPGGTVAVNDNVVTGIVGANNPDGIIFHANQSGAEVVKFKLIEVIVRKVYDTGDDLINIYNYCVKKK